MDKKVKIRVYASTGYVGSERIDTIEVDIPDGLTEPEEEQYLEDAAQEWLWGKINFTWSVEE